MNTNEATTTQATEQAPGKKGSKRAKKQAKAAKKQAKPATKKETKPASKKAPKTDAAATPREGSKKQIVLDLLRRKDGATMAEIAAATNWQKHSIRGFISGALSKKMGLTVESIKNEAGERTYRISQ